MSGGRTLQRISVFVVFTALAAAASTALTPAVPASSPTIRELGALEEKMVKASRLHDPAAEPAPWGSAPWCAECHPGPTHAGTGVAAAMLNAHAGRMDCLLCHWPAAAGLPPAPSWQVQAGTGAFLGVFPGGPPPKERLAALRAAAAAGRPCFARGSSCAACHRPGGLATLARPGSPVGHTSALERIERYFSLAPGDKWYFPQIQ
jgi:hypothetical protein